MERDKIISSAGYEASCVVSGKRDNLLMVAHRNDKGEMVGWVFVNKDEANKVFSLKLKIEYEALNP